MNLVLSDGSFEEMVPFLNGLNETSSEPYELKIHPANGIRSGKMRDCIRYAKYFIIPFFYFINRRKYERIVGWQQFYALIFCFYCCLFRVKKRNLITVANYTYRAKSGRVGKLYEKFMKCCTNPKYLDNIHVLSYTYADLVSKQFGFPRERIVVTPFGTQDVYDRMHALSCPDGVEKNAYFLSIGRSNRDFDFLIDAWIKGGIRHKLVVISDTYYKVTEASNVIILRNISGENQYAWVANCRAEIIPIDDDSICAGDTVLLTAMSLRKIVVATQRSTLTEMYIKNGYNGLVVGKDIKELSGLIEDIWNGQYDSIQNNARESFLQEFTREKMGLEIGKRINSMQPNQPVKV